MPQILEVIPHAGSLNIRLISGANVENAIREISTLAAQHKVYVDKLQLAQADLEDVFVALLETAEQEGGA